MRSAKLLFFCLVLIVLGVVVYQNIGLLTQKGVLKLELPFMGKYESPPLQLSLCFLGFFLVGVLFTYIHGLGERFKARKVIKGHLQSIQKLKDEIKAIKSAPVKGEEAPQEPGKNT
jgi:hypothetical protein